MDMRSRPAHQSLFNNVPGRAPTDMRVSLENRTRRGIGSSRSSLGLTKDIRAYRQHSVHIIAPYPYVDNTRHLLVSVSGTHADSNYRKRTVRSDTGSRLRGLHRRINEMLTCRNLLQSFTLSVLITLHPGLAFALEDTFTAQLPGALHSIDPHKTNSSVDSLVNPLVYEPLIAIDGNYKYVGVLAESWEVSEDGKRWIFNLRPNVRFHNKRSLTAADVVFSIKRILDPKTNAIMRSNYLKIQSVKALSDLQVEILLDGGYSTFVTEIGLGVRTAIIAHESVDVNGEVSTPIGTGPYVFESWEKGTAWRARRFEDYWGKSSEFRTVTFLSQSDGANTFSLLGKMNDDGVDFIPWISPDEAVTIQNLSATDYVVHSVNMNNTLSLRFNTQRGPFRSLELRKAVAYAIDKSSINAKVFAGMGTVHNQPFPVRSVLFLDVPDVYSQPNLQEARALVSKSEEPEEIEVVMIHPRGWLPKFVEELHRQLSPLGIRLKVDEVNIDQWMSRAKSLEYDLFIDVVENIFHWDRILGYFDTNSSSNWLVGGYDNSSVSELLHFARQQRSMAESKPFYEEILGMVQDDVGILFLQTVPKLYTWRAALAGFEPNPANGYLVWPGGGLNYARIK